MPYYCYLLQCSDGSFYCGWTTNLEKRLACHNRGSASRYTRIRRPVKLVYYEECQDRSAAMKHERRIKSFSHSQKQVLVKKFNDG